ncbi:MAG: FAD-dependent oxidoreductase [Oscillospiraceae bacterium]|nr:FAD-dependent oxidoreductase [Oscillospiraceae bacterium]
MSEDRFDVIVVGGGLAGSAAAYALAKAGVEVAVIERGESCGSKNMTGGRLYGHSLKKLIPDFEQRAPLERRVTRERVSLMSETGSTTVEFDSASLGEGAASYTVIRGKFDRWLAAEAEKLGATYVCGIRVDDLIVRNGRVRGIIAGEDRLEADVVILADGVNSLLAQKIGLAGPTDPNTVAVGLKEVIKLSEQQMKDRFGAVGDEGTAWLFAGDPTLGSIGGGFLYTNKDSVSLGIVATVGDVEYSDTSVVNMLDRFKEHRLIAPLIDGGELLEYSAHLVPEGGYDAMPELYGDGVLVAGDAAGMVLNLGYMVRGMDLAIEAGRQAANAVLYARRRGDYSRRTLSAYRTALENSFVLRDMKLYRKAPQFMENRRVFTRFPLMLEEIMRSMFTVDGERSEGLVKKVAPIVGDAGVAALARDAIQIVSAL